MRVPPLALVSCALVACALASSTANAGGPWTRDAGSFYVQASGTRLATRTLYLASYDAYTFCSVGNCRYVQTTADLYAEVGVLTRWLTLVGNASVWRTSELEGSGRTEGVGDARIGAWTGLLTDPFHAAFGVTLGIPVGDAHPGAGAGADSGAAHVARALATGDGEWNVELRLSVGETFGGWPRWPLRHFFVGELGAWIRTGGYSSAFVYRALFGTTLPWSVLERLTLVARFFGVESHASELDVSRTATPFGLGNGVSYIAVGGELSARLWRGLVLAGSVDYAPRGRAMPEGALVRVALSFER